MICFLPTVMPATLHVGNLKVIDITLKCKQNFKYNEQQKLAFFTDTKRWTLSSVRRKKSVSVMEHAFYQGNTREMSVDCSGFFDSPQQQ